MLQLRHGARIVEILKQPQGAPLPVEQQVLLLFAVAVTHGDKKFFRPILPRYVVRTEAAFLNFFTQGHYLTGKPADKQVDLLKAIREEKTLSDGLKEKMVEAIEDFLWMPYEQMLLMLGDPKNKDALGLSPAMIRYTEDALLLFNFNERFDVRTLVKRENQITADIEAQIYDAISPTSQFAKLKSRGFSPEIKDLIRTTTNFLTRLLEQRSLYLNEKIMQIREIKSRGEELPDDLKAQLIKDLVSMLERDELKELFEKFDKPE